ncbi:hypothetical protein ACFO1B_00925 [Dactylosporangium siamense]|uniref:hypothetical protein n=1 Tax=Dactylosporangium siamense TaxID=685454 RepID=UPI001940EB58|nr:hypothetical protein [Dactylosporangium siamense]
MSYTFITAARITMPRKGFDAWLGTPLPPASTISNPASMFEGWYWSSREASSTWTSSATTPRDLLAERLTDPTTLTVVRHHDGALEAYLWTVGYSGAWEGPAQQLLLMLAGAGAFKDDDSMDHVLFWEDAAGALPTRNEDALLALLAVDRQGARFIGRRPLADLLAGLSPVEEAFAELAEVLEESLDEGAPQPLDPTYVDLNL